MGFQQADLISTGDNVPIIINIGKKYMQKYVNSVQDTQGNAIPGARVTVTNSIGGAVTVYSDNISTVLPNVITDAYGMFFFYAPDGRYNLTISAAGVTLYTLSDIQIDDSLANVQTAVATNITELKALDKTVFSYAETSGFYTKGDGGHGDYWYDSTDTTSVDNGCTVIVATDGARWKLFGQERNVRQCGAKGNGSYNDAPAFMAAIASITGSGGKIVVPHGTYYFATAVDQVTKSIYWDIQPGARFTGPGYTVFNFPCMKVNGAQVAAGPYIIGRDNFNAPVTPGGTGAFNVEYVAPSSQTSNGVALFVGARGNNATGDVWAMNPVITADASAGGVFQGIELDVNNHSATSRVKGMSINGVGSSDVDVGIELIRTDSSQYTIGINVRNSAQALRIEGNGLSRGIVINESVVTANTLLTGTQLTNGADSIVLHRNTDTAPSGFFLRLVDAANVTNLLTIGITGTFTSKGVVQGSNLRADVAAVANAGTLNLGGTTALTVGAAGAAMALPANPLGYLVAYTGTTKIKIPYYND